MLHNAGDNITAPLNGSVVGMGDSGTGAVLEKQTELIPLLLGCYKFEQRRVDIKVCKGNLSWPFAFSS